MEQEEDLQDSYLFVAGRGLDCSSKKWMMVFSLPSKKQGCCFRVLWEKGGAPEKGEQAG